MQGETKHYHIGFTNFSSDSMVSRILTGSIWILVTECVRYVCLVSKLFLASVYFILDLCLQTTIDQSFYWSFSFRDRKKGPKSFLTTLFATFEANKMRSHKTFWLPQLADWPKNVGKYLYKVEFDISRIFSILI